MSRRTRRTLLIVAAVFVLLAVAVFLRSKAPPEAARLLPESDGILYIDLRPIHAFFHHDFKPLEGSPDYQQFVDATGVDWERDVEQVAISLHRMSNPNGPNGPVAYSMVLVGKITGKRLNDWLTSQAASREIYAGHTIYNISSQGRTVRVAQIGYDMVAVSNTPTPDQIHSILDRHRTAALPFSGSSVLQRYYHEVPLLSLVWGVGQIGLPFSGSGEIHVLGVTLPIQPDSTIIASVTPALPVTGSLRFKGSVRLRVEDIAPNDSAAANEATSLSTLVTLARGVSSRLADTQTNQGFKDLLDTAEVSRHGQRVVISATLPSSFFANLQSGL